MWQKTKIIIGLCCTLGAKLSPGQSQFLHPQTSRAVPTVTTAAVFEGQPGSMLKHLTNNNSGVASNVHLMYANLIICAQKTIHMKTCDSAHDFTYHYMQ